MREKSYLWVCYFLTFWPFDGVKFCFLINVRGSKRREIAAQMWGGFHQVQACTLTLWMAEPKTQREMRAHWAQNSTHSIKVVWPTLSLTFKAFWILMTWSCHPFRVSVFRDFLKLVSISGCSKYSQGCLWAFSWITYKIISDRLSYIMLLPARVWKQVILRVFFPRLGHVSQR